ncbi:hypothetical protein [Reichenbachiella versicolor]|uniref:hypothetical protein n=1 Tax=Reichenbachiella versicolor TaxID=1821036 RepID=UPI000D6E68DF|nr:hypothetical protein [Reichenbachiella versicolor]
MKTNSIAIILLVFTIISCQSKKEVTLENLERQDLLGEWNVQWVTKPEKGQSVDPSINYTMNGKMIFNEEKLTINAYGYEGCIFGSDTLSHSINWKVQGDTLSIVNDGDEFGIPYIIREISNEKVKLQLVEDVFLFLTKL